MKPAVLIYRRLHEMVKKQDRQRAMFGSAALPEGVDQPALMEAMKSTATVEPPPDEADVDADA